MTEPRSPLVPPIFLTGLTVADVMIREPKTLESKATVGEVRHLFQDDHVHLALVVQDGLLRGTLARADVRAAWADDVRVLALPQSEQPIISGGTPARIAFARMVERRERRLAVVESDGRLQGLLCLKRRMNGFCSDASMAERLRDETKNLER